MNFLRKVACRALTWMFNLLPLLVQLCRTQTVRFGGHESSPSQAGAV